MMANACYFTWPGLLAAALYAVYCLLPVTVWILLVSPYRKRINWTHWSNLCIGESPEWDPDIKLLTLQDPLLFKPKRRPRSWQRDGRDALVALLALTTWLLGLAGLSVLIKNPSKDHVEIASYLFGFITVIGAATRVTYDWRLKTRSENRQKWINEVRECLSFIIAGMPSGGDDSVTRKQKADVYAYQHAKLELLLNPSEKDHRALMALIRHIFGYDDVCVDNEPRKALDLMALNPKTPEDFRNLKSQIIRLSNAVLKREWERVKYIQ